MSEKLRNRFRSRDPLFGAWTSLGHPSITEIFAQSTVDFIGLDLEHSTISLEQAQALMSASQSAGVPCLPRLSSQNPEQIKRLLDSGADGVIVPMISSASEVKRMIEAVKYPPIGKRSYGISRAQRYGSGFDEYTSTWNKKGILLIQIESIQGVRAIDEILSHDEIDGAMVGPYDLSGSLNVPGQLFHPEVTKASQTVIEACRKYGKACGTQLVDPTEENMEEALGAGFTFTILASDIFLLWKWSERMKSYIHSVKSVKVS